MKKANLMGISPKSFKEGSENYNAVCEYNASMLYASKIMEMFAYEFKDFRQTTIAVANQMESKFDIEAVKKETNRYKSIFLALSSILYSGNGVMAFCFKKHWDIDMNITAEFLKYANKTENKAFIKGRTNWSDDEIDEAWEYAKNTYDEWCNDCCKEFANPTTFTMKFKKVA